MSKSSRVTARNRGKALERVIAKRTGGRRNGVTGLATADVEAGPWAIEAKSRKALPDWLLNAMGQAVRNTPNGMIPICVLHQLGAHHGNDIVCMRLKDFEDWYGAIDIPEEP